MAEGKAGLAIAATTEDYAHVPPPREDAPSPLGEFADPRGSSFQHSLEH